MNSNSSSKSNLEAEAEELQFLTVDSSDDHEMNTNNMLNPNSNPNNNGSNNGNSIGSYLFTQSKHPMVAFFHLLFKSLALFLYIFGSYFTSNFIIIFVLVVILLAFDFWVVKNVSGRLLVGLRWWSMNKEDGSNEFIFESLQDMSDISPVDYRIFWWGMYVTILLWCLCLFVGILRLNFTYVPIMIAAISMTFANLWGYMKCSSDSNDKMKLFQQGLSTAATNLNNNSGMMMNFLTSSVMNMTGQNKNNTATNHNMNHADV